MIKWLVGVAILFSCGAGFFAWKQYSQSSLPAPLVRGDRSPAFQAKTLDGSPIQFPTNAPTTAIVFWASWCAPCAEETPGLVRFAKLNPNWKFLLISNDSTLKELNAFLKIFPQMYQPNISLIWDSDRSLAKKMGVSGYPESFFFEKEGNLIIKLSGAQNWDKLQIPAN